MALFCLEINAVGKRINNREHKHQSCQQNRLELLSGPRDLAWILREFLLTEGYIIWPQIGPHKAT